VNIQNGNMHQCTNMCAYKYTTMIMMHITIQADLTNHLQLNVFCPLQPYGHSTASES